MKIILLSGGASIHTIRWANGLADAGIEVILATQHDLLEPVDAHVRVRRLPHSGVVGYFRNAGPLKQVIEEEKPDLLNAHYASGYGTTARLAGFHPYVLSVWGSDVYDVPDKSWFHKRLIRKNVLAADQVTSTSHVMADQTRKVVPHVDQIDVVPFGIDTEKFTVSKNGENPTERPVVIGTVKTLAHKYGIDTLLEAFALLVESIQLKNPALAKRLQLRIVGDGPDQAILKQKARTLEISHQTEFVGRVPYSEVPNELNKLDIYVALSRLDSESFGVAILEASACGAPVVVSDAGGFPEVVVDGVTGQIVPRENPGAAASALEELVGDTSMRRRMGDAGRRHVLEHYQWTDNVQEMISVYRQTLPSDVN